MICYNKDKDTCVLSCGCGCGDSVQLSVEYDNEFSGSYFYHTLLDSSWNFEQQGWMWRFKKIWAILRNKDYHYSEICMTKKEFDEYKEWINQF